MVLYYVQSPAQIGPPPGRIAEQVPREEVLRFPAWPCTARMFEDGASPRRIPIALSQSFLEVHGLGSSVIDCRSFPDFTNPRFTSAA